MFVHFDQLQTLNLKKLNKYKVRWNTESGRRIHSYINDKFKEVINKYFLTNDYDLNAIDGFLKDNRDLRGINLSNITFEHKIRDFFKYFDFSYAEFHSVKFINCDFWQPTFFLSNFYNCKFINCTFHFATFYACTFDNCDFIDSSFIEYDKIFNSDFKNSSFNNLFISTPLFKDCQFNSTVEISDLSIKPVGKCEQKMEFDSKNFADHYLALSEGYESGRVAEKRRVYLYKAKDSYYKFNTFRYKKFTQLLIKWFTGFGLKPLRPLAFSLIVIAVGTFIFLSNNMNIGNAFLTSASAFLTVGDYSSLYCPYNYFFMIESFLGVFSFGLFLGTLLNLWFSER